jgi:hypothetical protein
MSRLLTLNLIALFDYYLMLTFILSVYLRVRQYQELVSLVVAVPGRWPKLFRMLKQHQTLFLTWQTLLPIALTLVLMLVHSAVYNFVWPSARVTPRDLWVHWVGLIFVLGFALVMVYLDFDAVFNIGQLDRPALERDLDQAEYWLRSWMAPAVRIITFGRVNPRRMVQEEVRKALTAATVELNKMMWRWSLQIGIRLSYGLSLWLTWAWVLTRPAVG